MRQKHKRRQAAVATHSLSGISADWPQAVIKICFSSAFQRAGLVFGGWLSVVISPHDLFSTSVETHAFSSLSTLPARYKNAFI